MRSINIRAIQHYMYCPRRFGLLEINDDWSENASVVKANLMHERVHDGRHKSSSTRGFSDSSIRLYNDELDIFGVSDCIEFERSKNGDCEIKGDRYIVKVVEYKPTAPKSGEISKSDAIQVFAQKLCVDKIFSCNCESYIYYSDVRRRVKLPFDVEYEKYYQLIATLISEMRDILENGEIPHRRKSQKCAGCSMESICMPKSVPLSIKNELFKELDKVVEA